MRFFFRSKQFKKIISVVAVVLVITVTLAVIGGTASPTSNIMGAVFTPVQSAFNNAANAVKGFFAALTEGENLMQENQRLQDEVNRLTSQVIENQQAVRENEFYKNYLEIKDNHPEFQFQPASIIASDKTDIYKTLVINKGSLDAVELYDPVITDAGLVGYVTEVALSYAKVSTVLSSEIKIGAKDSRTSDIGIVSGRPEFAKQSCTQMYNLPRSSSVTVGDYVITNGGGIFPAGLLIGTIEEVKPQQMDISVYAVVKPAVDFDNLNDVMVLTYFPGQGVASFQTGEK